MIDRKPNILSTKIICVDYLISTHVSIYSPLKNTLNRMYQYLSVFRVIYDRRSTS